MKGKGGHVMSTVSIDVTKLANWDSVSKDGKVTEAEMEDLLNQWADENDGDDSITTTYAGYLSTCSEVADVTLDFTSADKSVEAVDFDGLVDVGGHTLKVSVIRTNVLNGLNKTGASYLDLLKENSHSSCELAKSLTASLNSAELAASGEYSDYSKTLSYMKEKLGSGYTAWANNPANATDITTRSSYEANYNEYKAAKTEWDTILKEAQELVKMLGDIDSLKGAAGEDLGKKTKALLDHLADFQKSHPGLCQAGGPYEKKLSSINALVFGDPASPGMDSITVLAFRKVLELYGKGAALADAKAELMKILSKPIAKKDADNES